MTKQPTERSGLGSQGRGGSLTARDLPAKLVRTSNHHVWASAGRDGFDFWPVCYLHGLAYGPVTCFDDAVAVQCELCDAGESARRARRLFQSLLNTAAFIE